MKLKGNICQFLQLSHFCRFDYGLNVNKTVQRTSKIDQKNDMDVVLTCKYEQKYQNGQHPATCGTPLIHVQPSAGCSFANGAFSETSAGIKCL